MDNGAFGIPEDDDVAKDVEKPDSPLNAKFKRAAEKATEKATGARDKAVCHRSLLVASLPASLTACLPA